MTAGTCGRASSLIALDPLDGEIIARRDEQLDGETRTPADRGDDFPIEEWPAAEPKAQQFHFKTSSRRYSLPSALLYSLRAALALF